MVTIPSACESAIQVRHACSLRASATRASDLERGYGRRMVPLQKSQHTDFKQLFDVRNWLRMVRNQEDVCGFAGAMSDRIPTRAGSGNDGNGAPDGIRACGKEWVPILPRVRHCDRDPRAALSALVSSGGVQGQGHVFRKSEVIFRRNGSPERSGAHGSGCFRAVNHDKNKRRIHLMVEASDGPVRVSEHRG